MAGCAAGEQVPVASRLAQLAEYVEVAHRIGGVEAVKQLARERGGRQFDPRFAALVHDEAGTILADLDSTLSWEAVIEAEPALSLVLSGAQLDGALEGSRTSSTSSRRTSWVIPALSPSSPLQPGSVWASRRRTCERCAGPR